AFGGVHDVAAAPEVMEGVVDRDGAAAVLVGEADAGLDGLAGDGLAELAVGVPALHGGETTFADLDLRAGDTTAGSAAEEFVEVERLERVVGANPVPGGLAAHARGGGGFLRLITTVLVSGGDQSLVLLAGNNKISGSRHGNAMAWIAPLDRKSVV